MLYYAIIYSINKGEKLMKSIRIYISLTVIIFTALGLRSTIFTNATAATIKTKDTTLTTPGSMRNVSATGKYALYTKPGTTKGAKLIASKAKLQEWQTYTNVDRDYYQVNGKNKLNRGSGYYLRAYCYTVTNTGAVYYKVVTMNGKYRGYLYGGKKVGKFAGGLKPANTTQSTLIPTNFTANVGIISGGTLWNQVPYTQYKAKRLAHMTDFNSTTIPHLAKFKITKAIKRTKEQDTYYQLVSTDNYHFSGWVNSIYVDRYSSIADNWGVDATD